jgi:hypothetical protein
MPTKPMRIGSGFVRESVLFIGTQFSNPYTAEDTPGCGHHKSFAGILYHKVLFSIPNGNGHFDLFV